MFFQSSRMVLPLMVEMANHATDFTEPRRKRTARREGLMNAYSVMTKLLRPATEISAAFEVQQPILLPRMAAGELPGICVTFD